MKRIIYLVACAVLIVVLFGCGGAQSANSSTGRLTLTVVWPKKTRLIPLASNSIRAIVTQGSQTLGTQLIVGSDGPPSAPSLVTFDNLPAGPVTLTATAYPTRDGSGVAQATGSQSVPIVSGQTATVTVTMASTIDHVTLTPANPSITVGPFLSLRLNAFDAAGNMVIVPFTAQFVSSNTNVIREAAGGNPAAFQGLAAGTAVITATETDSGKSASTTVTVTTAGGE